MRYLRQGIFSARQGEPAAMLLECLPWSLANEKGASLLRCLWKGIYAVQAGIRDMFTYMWNRSQAVAQGV
jgi:hypothetical protein